MKNLRSAVLRDSILKFTLCSFLVLVSFGFAKSQIWNSNAGGYNGGYGQVYQTFGLAQATINMQNQMNMNIQRAIMQQAMENQFGKEAVERAQKNGSSSNQASAKTQMSAPKNYAFFRPDARANNFKIIADTIGKTANEKEFMKQLFAETKSAFENEVAAKGRKNNIAAAMTFFIASTVTVYQDAAEPEEQAAETLFLALNMMFDETSEMANVPDRDKQFLYDTFLSFGGLVYAGYLQAKETKDEEMLKQYRQIAGALLQDVLKINPNKLRFENSSLRIEK